MAIPSEFIQNLLASVDVVDVVGRFVPLKKSGANFSGLCPFHTEKTPSFSVSPSKQFFHCFGCGKHGNAIGFLIEHAGMNFVDAVKELAQGSGLSVPDVPNSPQNQAHTQQVRQHQTQLSELLEKISMAYRQQLRTAPRAIDYLKSRGLSGEIALQFGVGYAPDEWRFLAEIWPNYSDPMLSEAGMVIDKDSPDEAMANPGKPSRYDRFRDRIMFPIRSVKGECIGFGGRVLGDAGPKYLNSPETPVFSKGRELYGLFEARQAIRVAGHVLVTEGYMDVLALVQNGFPNTVATLGTACTSEHIQKLFRFTDSVVFGFDGDAAGRRAARKALLGALPYATDVRQVKFLFLPPEHDPDSFIRNLGADAFRQCVAGAMPLSQWVLEIAREGCDLGHAEGRALLASQAKPLLSVMPNGVLKSHLLTEVSDLVQIGMHELLRLWGTTRPTDSARPRWVGDPQSRPHGQYARPDQPMSLAPLRSTRRIAVRQSGSREDRAIQMLFTDMAAWNRLSSAQQALLCGLSGPHGEAFRWLDQQAHEQGALPWSALYQTLIGHPLSEWATQLVLSGLTDVGFDQTELNSILLEIEKLSVAKELSAMAHQIETQPALLEPFRSLSRRLTELKSKTAQS